MVDLTTADKLVHMGGGMRAGGTWSNARTVFARENLSLKWSEARAGGWWNALLLGLVAVLAVPAGLLAAEGITLWRAMGPGGIAGTVTITSCAPYRSGSSAQGWSCDGMFASADDTVRINRVHIFPYIPGNARPSGAMPARVASATSTIANTGAAWKWAIPFVGGLAFATGAAWLFYIIYLEPEPPSRRKMRRRLDAVRRRAQGKGRWVG